MLLWTGSWGVSGSPHVALAFSEAGLMVHGGGQGGLNTCCCCATTDSEESFSGAELQAMVPRECRHLCWLRADPELGLTA